MKGKRKISIWTTESRQTKIKKTSSSNNIVEAYSFELGKCDMPIRQMNIDHVLAHIDLELAQKVAKNLGVTPPEEGGNDYDKISPALSQDDTIHVPDTRKVGIIIDDGFNDEEILGNIDQLTEANVKYEVISEYQGTLTGSNEASLEVDHTFDTTDAVLYDALYVVGGSNLSQMFKKETKKFLHKTFDHYKTIGASQAGIDILEKMHMLNQPGVVTEGDRFADDFIEAIAKDRHRTRDIEVF